MRPLIVQRNDTSRFCNDTARFLGKPYPFFKTCPRKGLTLVELIVVLVLLLFIGLALGGLVRSMADTQRRIEQISEISQVGRIAVQRFIADLSSSFSLLTPDGMMFFHENDTEKKFNLDSDKLRFASMVADPRRTEMVQSDMLDLHYFVDTDPQTPGQGLIRSVTVVPTTLTKGEDAEGKFLETISPRIISLNFRFYDSDTDEWSDTWESSENGEVINLPSLVEITIGVAPTDCDQFLSLLDQNLDQLNQLEFFKTNVSVNTRSNGNIMLLINR